MAYCVSAEIKTEEDCPNKYNNIPCEECDLKFLCCLVCRFHDSCRNRQEILKKKLEKKNA